MATPLASFGLILLLQEACKSRGDADESCAGYALAEYVVRSAILLIIVIAMNFRITQARQRAMESIPPIVADTATLYSKLDQFSVFRWCFLAYLLSPTVLVIIEAAVVVNWELAWISIPLDHLSFLLIHVHLACHLAPGGHQMLIRPFVRNSGM